MAESEVRIKVTANTTQAKTALGQFGSKLDEVVRGVTGFSLASIGTIGAVTGVVNAVKRGVDEWQNYALSSKDASAAIGVTVEDFTRLVQVADDARLSQAQLTTALQMMAKNGVAPSIENLAKLSDELRGMSVTDRAAKLSELFGRNWKEVYKILKDGGQALKDNTQAVADGLVVTGEAADEAEAYFKAVDNLNDSLTELKNGALKDLIPLLTKGVNTANGVTLAWKNTDSAAVKLIYSIPGLGLALQALDGHFYQTRDANNAALATVRQMPDAMRRSETAIDDMGEATQEAAVQADAMGARYTAMAEKHKQDTQTMADKLRGELLGAYEEVNQANIAWAKGAGGEMSGMLEQAGLDAGQYNQALIALDSVMGTNEYTAKLQQDAMKKLVDEFKRTGDISAFEDSLMRLKNGGFQAFDQQVVTARVHLQEMWAEMMKQDGQTVTVYYNVVDGPGGGGTLNRTPTPPRKAGGYDPTDYDAAGGADFIVPANYPNDSFRMGLTSGEHVTVTPAGKNGGTPWTIIQNFYGPTSPQAVRSAMKLTLASYGKQYQGVS